MKRLFFILSLCFATTLIYAQGVFTVVSSSDDFINVYSKPSSRGRVVAEIGMGIHGLGDGVLLQKGRTWSLVSVYNVKGWARTKNLVEQTWYSGKESTRLVAAKDGTLIYRENLGDDEEMPVFATLSKGTIIADSHYEDSGDDYALITAHDYLFVRKKDVIIEKVKKH